MGEMAEKRMERNSELNFFGISSTQKTKPSNRLFQAEKLSGKALFKKSIIRKTKNLIRCEAIQNLIFGWLRNPILRPELRQTSF